VISSIIAPERRQVARFQAVEAIVDGVAQAILGRLGEVQAVLLQEGARRLELLAREAAGDQALDLAQGGARGEGGLRLFDRADPDLEELRAPADPGRRHRQAAAVGGRLDVGVVAVVQSARLADHLVEVARAVSVLAEPGVGDPQRVELAAAARDVDRVSEADGRRGPWLLDDHDLATGDRARLGRGDALGRALAQTREVGCEAPGEILRIRPAQRDHQVVARAVTLEERAHVVEDERRERPDGAELGVTVGRAAKTSA
jgi:hypothetical protein